MLREAGIGGRVRVQFVVDTAGRPIENSLQVLRTDNDLFSLAARDAIGKWRFQPASRGRRRVADTLIQLIDFDPKTTKIGLLLKPVATPSKQIEPGEWYIQLSGPDPVPAMPTVDAQTQRELAFAVLDTLLAELVPPDTARLGRIACIAMSQDRRAVDARTGQLRPDEPSVAELAALQRTRLAVVPARRCPPTYSSPARYVRVDGSFDAAPPGEDPFDLEVKTGRALGDGRMLIGADVEQGTGGRAYLCVATQDSVRISGWRAVCTIDRNIAH